MLNIELLNLPPNGMRVRLTGELVLGQESQSLRDTLNALVLRVPDLTLDLAGVTKLDSIGVGVLVGAKALADSRGHTLHAVNMTAKVRDLLLLVKLLTVLEEPARAA